MIKTAYNSGNRGSFNPLTPGGTPTVATHQELTNEAIVTDVIVNDSHPEYANDGYNIGAIQFRSIKGDMFRNDETLQWAFPLESNISEYPLLNEIVLVHNILNRVYYTRKVNTTNRVTAHAVPGLNEEMSAVETSEMRSKGFRTHTSERRITENRNDVLGSYFVDSDGTYRLRHDEGDIVLEGRSGQSLRLGAAWKSGTMFQSTANDQSPNIIIRVGPDPLQIPKQGRFGLVKEDVNGDASSIYIVSDQIVPLKYSTDTASNHAKSIHNLPKRLEGSQIVINTNRIVFNAKNDTIMGFAKSGVHWTSGQDFTVDSDKNYESTITNDEIIEIGNDQKQTVGNDSIFKIGNIYDITTGKRASIVAPKVYIGLHEGDDEPISCGAMLADFLEKFLDAFIQNAPGIALITAAPGSPSPLNPKILTALNRLKMDVSKGAKASFNSTIAYTTKK